MEMLLYSKPKGIFEILSLYNRIISEKLKINLEINMKSKVVKQELSGRGCTTPTHS
jgi:hypothetical protein